jgi:hypothetical protein
MPHACHSSYLGGIHRRIVDQATKAKTSDIQKLLNIQKSKSKKGWKNGSNGKSA